MKEKRPVPRGSSSNYRPFGYMNIARDITPRKIEQEALVQSQHFVQRILDTSPNIIYILDLERRRFRYINPEITPILGYSVDEFFNAPYEVFSNHLTLEDIPRMEQHLQNLQALKEGEVAELEYQFMSRHQKWRWLKSRETVFSRNESGKPTEIIGVIQDITASKQAEARLQHRLNSERMLAAVSNNFLNAPKSESDQAIREAVLMVTKFTQVDFGLILLLDEDELVPYHLCPLKSQGNIPLLDSLKLTGQKMPWLLERLKQQETILFNHSDFRGSGNKGELPIPAEEKDWLKQRGIGSAIFLPMVYNQALYGVLAFGLAQNSFNWNENHVYMLKTFGEMVTNALVQKKVDQALRKSEARYRAIVEEHQTEMICRFLHDTTLTFVNEAYCKYYGKERSALIGTDFLTLVLPDDREQVRSYLASLSTQVPVVVFEQRIQQGSGEVRWQEWTSRAIFDLHNDFIEFQAVGRDITERKKMEEQLKTAQTHLAQAARLASIGELASGVAHQISNPLTTIIADAQILLHQLDRKHLGHDSAEAIVQAGWRAQQVINELLKFSQPTQDTHVLTSLNETIEKAVLLAGAHIQAFGIKLVTDLSPDLPQIFGNPRQLTDLWVTLLLLARSASDDGAYHTIRIHSRLLSDDNLLIEVTDDGRPIPREQFENIFEPQLVPTGSGRGTGMELSICREIVRQNRGQILIMGNKNETTFQIIFPREGKH